MRILKLVGVILVLAFAAIGTATASAAETLVPCLPCTTGTKSTGKSGKATLQIKGSGSVTCAETSAEGEMTSEQTLALAVATFSKCTVGGLSINSLGDSSGIVLVHTEGHSCLIGPGHLGALTKVLSLHLEIPSVKLLLMVEGAAIGEVTPIGKKVKTFNAIVEQKEGKQAIEKCEGGTAQTLLVSLDGGAFKQAGEEAKEGTATPSVEEEAME